MDRTDKLTWSRLSSLQVGKYAEYFVKMEFTLYGFDVYTSEVDDKGIDFVVCTKDRQRYYDVQIKSVRGFDYVFLRKEHFSQREPVRGIGDLARRQAAGGVSHTVEYLA